MDPQSPHPTTVYPDYKLGSWLVAGGQLPEIFIPGDDHDGTSGFDRMASTVSGGRLY